MTNPLEAMRVSEKRRKRFITYGFLATILISLAYLIMIADPLQRVAERMLALQEGSWMFGIWQKPPIEILIAVYIFNITNGDRFLSGLDEKLAVEEIGPYTYREYLENENVTFNSNGTLSYIPHRWTEFIRERSVGDPMEDMIVALNVPLLGLSTYASDISFFAALGVSTLAKSTGSKTLLNLTAHDFLWGYEDSMVRLASNIVPSFIDFERFGLLDRMFDDGINRVTINLPERISRLRREEEVIAEPLVPDGPLSDFFRSTEADFEEDPQPFRPKLREFSINSWNDSPGLEKWGFWPGNDSEALRSNTPCNTLQGAYDGAIFPRKIAKSEVFKVYRKCFCRTLPVRFIESQQVDGVEGYIFALTENAFDNDNEDPDTACYCQNKKCMKKGLGNITPCYYNIPTALSLPHFYKSDPSLLKDVDGLSPDPEKHESLVILQPQLGIPMKVNSRIQFNLVMGETRLNQNLKRFENIVFPIFWADIKIEKLPPDLTLLLQLLFIYGPVVQVGIVCVLVAIAIALFVAAALQPRRRRFAASSNSNRDARYSAKYSVVSGRVNGAKFLSESDAKAALVP